MWRELLEVGDRIGVRLADPATETAVAEAGRALGSVLPDALTDLLVESDGIADQYGHGLVWPVGQLVERNLEIREASDFAELHMPFDSLLFFGEIGNGDLVGFRVLRGVTPKDIYVWDHELDSRIWIAPTLESYLRKQLGAGAA
ncbi:MAG TPA: SMI1/KNR4 family protein [Candidatus Limnocylindrales bacterium]